MRSRAAGAALTATSVGSHANESQISLGAAVTDDILGLNLLTIVGTLAAGERLTVLVSCWSRPAECST